MHAAKVRPASWRALLSAGMVLGTLLAGPARAQIGSDRFSSLVVDAGTGAILSSVNADEPRYPASLTKMMTLYMVFEALRDRRIDLNQLVPVTWNAASMPPSKLGITAGSRITVEQAILALVTKSANDVAAALGEMLGGDEDRFAQMMTLRARAIGMARTTFRNASGLPDWDQVTTARDIAVLSRRLINDFPLYYTFFSAPSFQFRGRTIWNHVRIVQTYPGADGLKTGYIDASGHNLAASAVRGGTRLIGVVLGANGNAERDAHMTALLDQGFEQSGVPPVVMARRPPAQQPYLPSVAGLGSFPSFLSQAQAAPLRPSSRPGPMPVQASPIGRGKPSRQVLVVRKPAAGKPSSGQRTATKAAPLRIRAAPITAMGSRPDPVPARVAPKAGKSRSGRTRG